MREVRSDRVLEGGGKGKGQIRDAMNRKRVFECTARSNDKLAGSAERVFRYPCLRSWDNMQIRDGGYGNRERTAACHRVGLEEECKKRRIRNESRSTRDTAGAFLYTISRQRDSRPRRGIYGPPGHRTGDPLMAGEGGYVGWNTQSRTRGKEFHTGCTWLRW